MMLSMLRRCFMCVLGIVCAKSFLINIGCNIFFLTFKY